MLKNHMSTCKKTHVNMQHLFLMNQILPLPRAGPEGVLEVISDSAASAHVMGSGVLAVDARAIGCLGVDRCG